MASPKKKKLKRSVAASTPPNPSNTAMPTVSDAGITEPNLAATGTESNVADTVTQSVVSDAAGITEPTPHVTAGQAADRVAHLVAAAQSNLDEVGAIVRAMFPNVAAPQTDIPVSTAPGQEVNNTSRRPTCTEF